MIEMFLLRWENENTRAAYRAGMLSWTRWCGNRGRDPIYGVHRTDVEAWILDMRADGLAHTTINHRIVVLRIWFELAVDDRLIEHNPCRIVRKLRVPRDNSRKSLHMDELQALLEASSASRPAYHALIVLMLYCGLRVSEVTELDVTDVQVTERSHRCARVTRKGGERTTIPMPPDIHPAVDAAIGGRESGPLLLGPISGERLTRRRANEVVKMLARRAGIEPVITCHWLRHTFTVTALINGVDPNLVQQSLGHAELSTTLRWYNRARFTLDDHASYAVAGFINKEENP